MNQNTIYQIAVWLIPLIIAIVFHEVAHGLVARRLGDPTAEERGRLSLNPIRHVDPVGTLILPMILAITHAPIFGWAKPVPVNYARLRNPRRDMVLVALAGPGMNLLLAIAGAAILAATVIAVRRRRTGGAARFIAEQRAQLHLHQRLPRRVQPAPGPAVRRRPCRRGRCSRRTLAAQFHKIGRFSLLVLVLLLLVLPALSPRADVVGRVVSPIVNGIAWPFSGFSASAEPCSTAGSSSTSRSGSARPRR